MNNIILNYIKVAVIGIIEMFLVTMGFKATQKNEPLKSALLTFVNNALYLSVFTIILSELDRATWLILIYCGMAAIGDYIAVVIAKKKKEEEVWLKVQSENKRLRKLVDKRVKLKVKKIAIKRS